MMGLEEPTSGLKVFSASKARDRQLLGEQVTAWLREHNAVGVHAEVLQSSDMEFHCMSIVLWYRRQGNRGVVRRRLG